jgi:hypothetical protein
MPELAPTSEVTLSRLTLTVLASTLEKARDINMLVALR